MNSAEKVFPVLMADVMGSRSQDGEVLATYLVEKVAAANAAFPGRILSPLTVTLGDEFQGVVRDVESGIKLILWLEHQLRAKPLQAGKGVQVVRLRYVLHEGRIETPVNPKRAHGMLGPGLTRARELLTERGRGLRRMRIALADPLMTNRLDELFFVLDTLSEDWNPQDFTLIEAMMEGMDSETLAKRFQRHRTSIDRRRKNLKIEAYQSIERLLLDLSNP